MVGARACLPSARKARSKVGESAPVVSVKSIEGFCRFFSHPVRPTGRGQDLRPIGSRLSRLPPVSFYPCVSVCVPAPPGVFLLYRVPVKGGVEPRLLRCWAMPRRTARTLFKRAWMLIAARRRMPPPATSRLCSELPSPVWPPSLPSQQDWRLCEAQGGALARSCSTRRVTLGRAP